MNSAHFHLLLNHVPLIGTLIGLLVCLSGFIFKDHSIRRIALAIFIFSAVFALPAYLTGEGAEEAIEHLAGVEKMSIEKHEDGALIFIWLIGALGVVALIGLISDITNRLHSARIVYAFTLVLSLAVLVAAYSLGNSGGEIRHPEIRERAQLDSNAEPDSD